MGRRSPLLPMLDLAAMLLRGDRDRAEASLVRTARDLDAPDAASLAAGLDALLLAYRREADLSPFGVLATHWDIARFLTNLRRMGAEEAGCPAILEEPVAAPLIITGLPRSGTSFLHDLLAEDPGNQAVRCWQTV